jgi:hypothetical protein
MKQLIIIICACSVLFSPHVASAQNRRARQAVNNGAAPKVQTVRKQIPAKSIQKQVAPRAVQKPNVPQGGIYVPITDLSAISTPLQPKSVEQMKGAPASKGQVGSKDNGGKDDSTVTATRKKSGDKSHRGAEGGTGRSRTVRSTTPAPVWKDGTENLPRYKPAMNFSSHKKSFNKPLFGRSSRSSFATDSLSTGKSSKYSSGGRRDGKRRKQESSY